MSETLMKRCLTALLLVALAAGGAAGQTRGGWLRGEWAGTGYQTDSESTWAMVLTFRRGRYTAEYPSLECAGRWRLLSLSRTRGVFRETITRGAEKCSPRGRVVIERLSARQHGYRYAHEGSKDYVASAILNRRSR